MNTQHDSIDAGNTPSAERPTYSAPRLQRLGRVSELTEINSNQAFDGGGYAS
jgi:hypothetical protein